MSIAYSYLLFIVLAIFLFCYFVATKVWINVVKEKEKNSQNEPSENKENRRDFIENFELEYSFLKFI